MILVNHLFDNNQFFGDSTKYGVYITGTAVTTNAYNFYSNQPNPINITTGPGAITSGDPDFIDEHFHIGPNSDALDNGTTSDTYVRPALLTSGDFELEDRFQGAGIDRGADERTQRPGFLFLPTDLSATINANETVTYTHWLTNTGDFVDSYTLAMENQVTPCGDATWSYSLQPTTITDLAPMAGVQVTLVVTGGQAGYVDVTTITATSASLLTASVQDTTSISQTAGVDIEQSSAQVGLPGDLVTYTHTLTNTGDGVDQFALTYTAVPTDWVVTIEPAQTGFLQPSTSIPFTVTVLVPADTLSGTMHMVTVTAVTEDPHASDTLTDTTTVGLIGGLTLEPDNSRDVPDGTSTVYTHTLTSYSNIVDTITLTATGSLPGWDVSITPESVVMNPLDSVEVEVTVTVPPGSGGLQHVTNVTATSTLPGVIATATNTTTVPIVTGILFTPNLTEVVFADSTVYYTHTLTNLGNLTDTFNIISNSVQGWLTDITTWPIEVAPGASVPVTAVITVPPGTPPLTDTLTITVTSQTEITTTATVTDTTVVIQYVEIEFIPDHDDIADPDTIQVYTHTLTNNGDGTDTFDLTYSGVPPRTVTLEPASSVTLNAGETAVITANLDIPFAASGLQNVTHITATSRVSPAISATVVNTTTVTGTPVTLGVLIEPDRMAIGDPMEIITYYHTVTNTGTVTDSIGLSVVSAWTATVDPTQVDDLAAGDSMPVTVTVTIPGTAMPGEEELAVVTAVSLSNPDDASSSVTDTTRVRQNHGLLFFPDNEQTTNADSTIVYTHTLHNTGNGVDTFAIMPNSGSGWATAVDSPVTLNADESTTIHITLTVPAGTEGQEDVMDVTASSVISSDFSAMTTNTTTVSGVPPIPDVDIEPDHTGYGTAGDVVQYIHVVTNTGTPPQPLM